MSPVAKVNLSGGFWILCNGNVSSTETIFDGKHKQPNKTRLHKNEKNTEHACSLCSRVEPGSEGAVKMTDFAKSAAEVRSGICICWRKKCFAKQFWWQHMFPSHSHRLCFSFVILFLFYLLCLT